MGLKITSETGRAALKAFGTTLEYRPESSSDPDIVDDSPTEWPGFEAQPYDFRERRRCDILDLANTAVDDDLNLDDITLGHPAYRGCKGCFEWGFRCPLLDEGSRYPCTECAADNTECELIAEPAVKRTCEGCRSRRQQCSYREERSDHAKPCQQCASASRKCVAGPASGRTRTGPSLDQVAFRPFRKQNAQARKHRAHARAQIAEPQTPSGACAQCLRFERGSRITHGRPPQCDHCCNRSKIPIVTAVEPQANLSYKGKEKDREIYGHKQGKAAAAEPAKSNRRRIIKTKLAHPIQFNYAYDDEEGIAPCHWCEDAVYGIFGLGEVEVEVIEGEDGQSFVEVAGGHAGTYGHSRMCEFCTLDRLKMTACRNHDIEPIEGMDPEKFDYDAVMEWMMPGMASLAPFAWCSICPSPAFYFCSTKPSIDTDGQEEDLFLGDQKGCGLLLCNSCAIPLVSEHGGKLDRLIDSLENDEDDGGFGIRADASFLHSKGELLRRMGAS